MHPMPALVPVHGIITPAQGGDLCRGFGDVGFHGPNIVQRAFRRGVSAVQESVERNRNIGIQDFHQGDDVILMGMHAAGAQQAHEVTGTAGDFELPDQRCQNLGPGNGALRDGLINARQFLHHHPARSQIHVTDFRISHLTSGKPHIQFRHL